MREILTATPHVSNAPSADTYAGIPTTTTAKRPPDTAIEYDPNGGVLLIRKGKCECLYTVAEFPTGWDGRAFVVTCSLPATGKTPPAIVPGTPTRRMTRPAPGANTLTPFGT
jgi:hypothetical protein